METEVVTANTTVIMHGLIQFFAAGVAASFAVENALGVLFTWEHYKVRLEGKGLKMPISLAVSYGVCHAAGIDFIQMGLSGDSSILGTIIAAGMVAGGSKKMAERWGNLKKTLDEIK